MKPIVAVLETMWGYSAGLGPRYFTINPSNTSGKRLYKLIGEQNAHRLLVTNACPERVTSAKRHGKPNPLWLLQNLENLIPQPSILLVCGKVAKKAYHNSGFEPEEGTKVLFIDHPAARRWTKKRLREVQKQIQ